MSLEQIWAFLEASEEIQFEAAEREEVYDWVTRTLCEQEYWKQSRGEAATEVHDRRWAHAGSLNSV